MKWEQTTINPNDAQFLETRAFQREEIAALYRVPMHLLQSLLRETNNNIEHQSLDYIRYSLRPSAVRIKQEINRKLLSGPFFVERDFNAFQRGDFASQTAGFALLRNCGVYSANDILRGFARIRSRPRMAAMSPGSPKHDSAEDAGQGRRRRSGSRSGADDRRRRWRADHRLPPGADRERLRRLFRDAAGRIVNRKKRDEAFAYRALRRSSPPWPRLSC